MDIRLGGPKALLMAGTVASYLGAITISKTIAVSFGSTGVGLAGSVMGLAALTAAVALSGQANVLPRWIATQADTPHRQLLQISSLASLLILMPTLLVVAPWSSLLLREAFPIWATLCGLSSLAFAGAILLQRPTFISTVSGPRAVVRYTITTSAASAVAVVVLVFSLPIEYLPLSLGIGTLAGAASGSLQIRRMYGGSRTTPTPFRQARVLIRLTKTASVGAVSDAVVFGLIPTVVLLTIGASSAGLFRAAWSIAALTWAFTSAINRFLLLPGMSAASVASESTNSTLRAHVPSIMTMATGGAAVVSWTGPILLPLLYARGFEDAATVLSMLAIGTAARVWISISGIALVSHNHQREYSVTHLVFVCVLLAATTAGGLTGNLTLLGATVTAAMLLGGLWAEWMVRRTLPSADWPFKSLGTRHKWMFFGLLLVATLPLGFR